MNTIVYEYETAWVTTMYCMQLYEIRKLKKTMGLFLLFVAVALASRVVMETSERRPVPSQ